VGGVPEAVYLTFHREYHKAVKEGVQVEFEEYYPPLRTWFAVRAYPSESGVSVYFQDVNQRRQTEGALRYSEKRFRSLVQYASDIVTVLDADGTVRYQSPSIERILGYEQEELVGTNVFDHVHPEDRERVWDTFAEALQNQGVSPLVGVSLPPRG
jgi:PAS domain-containing protein